MMVPELQGELLDAARAADTSVRHVYDPFVGCGTTLAEAMIRGLDFAGKDINPLAVLACRVKAGPYFPAAIRRKTELLLDRMATDSRRTIDVSFPGREKWFDDSVAVGLSRIRRAVCGE
ncbi:MAG: hypothetical protein COW34_12580 [Armatimonadetes bacterium CG17_big_fil_post_rev_8_21_14_2_50_66_6]|nr:MAG: hypothetical protein COW34_12580 [Armatimonadetes bacterium CG17_big_fil_post_rev_8_21_14_2_50_66_6]